MSQSPLRVALPKLFLWNEPERFQEYPAGLARAERDRLYTRLGIERDLFGIDPSLKYPNGRPRGRRVDGLFNLYGLEPLGQRMCLRGVGLLEREKGGVRVTEDGLRLGSAYRADPSGDGWVDLLVRQLLTREPRTRLLVGLVCSMDHRLQFELKGGRPSGLLSLLPPQGGAIAIEQRECDAFNQLLHAHGAMALGPYWASALNSDPDAALTIEWEGVASERPSTNDLPTALRKALVPMLHVGLLTGGGDEWTIDAQVLRARIGEDVARSLGLDAAQETAPMSDEESLVRAYRELVEPGGFVVVSKLAERFGELRGLHADECAAALDQCIRAAMYADRVRLLERHPGQASMGRGLFGEPESRKVRLDIDFTNNRQPDRQASDDHSRPGGNT